MKKIIILALFALLFKSLAFAQDSEEIGISSTKDDMTINIAGFNIQIGSPKEDQFSFGNKSKSKFEFDLIGPFYHGWSKPVQSQYYGDWAGHGDFLLPSDAFSFGMTFCRFSFGLDCSNLFKLNIAGRWTWTDYYFKEGFILKDVTPGHTIPVFENTDIRSKFYTSYMGIPVGLSYEIGDVKVAANISAEWLLKSYSRYKGSKEKEQISCINDFRSSVDLMVTYGWIGAYVGYGLTPMFLPDSGNDAHTLTFGFVFGFSL